MFLRWMTTAETRQHLGIPRSISTSRMCLSREQQLCLAMLGEAEVLINYRIGISTIEQPRYQYSAISSYVVLMMHATNEFIISCTHISM